MTIRILNALKFGWWAFQNPHVIQLSNMEVLTKLFALIMETASSHRHMTTKIAYIHPTEGDKEIVSLWAGAGVAADPFKRIKELREENAELKRMLLEKDQVNHTTLQ